MSSPVLLKATECLEFCAINILEMNYSNKTGIGGAEAI